MSSMEKSEIEDLKHRINRLSQERDSALEMWHAAEEAKEKLKIIHPSPLLDVKNQMEEMKQDYSDVINLLNKKVKHKTDEILILKETNERLTREMGILKNEATDKDNELEGLKRLVEKIKDERDELQTALEHCHNQIEELRKLELKTREKLVEAVSMTQEALNNENKAIEEKLRVENAYKNLAQDLEAKIGRNVDIVKKELDNNITSLEGELKIVTLEKNRITSEHQMVKLELQSKIKEMNSCNEMLSEQLKDMRIRQQNEASQFLSEREALRHQIITLQSTLQQIPTLWEEEERKGAECEKCSSLKIYIDKYQNLAEKYRKTAFKISEQYENVLKEERMQWRIFYNKVLSDKCVRVCN